MATLRNLKPSLLQLSFEEKLALHRAARQRRRTFNPTNKKVKTAIRKENSAVQRMVSKITPEEAAEILKLLGETI